jgi:hypothetical protein
MDLLFSGRSIWTMIHGIALGGGALLALAAALFSLRTLPATVPGPGGPDSSRALVRLLVLSAILLWLAVLIGTYVTFPPYRAAPPEGTADLSAYPRALIHANPDTVWLHAFGMEIKEHIPWMAAMLATAAAFLGLRYRSGILRDTQLRRLSSALLGAAVVLVAFVALLGVFINKVAPLE